MLWMPRQINKINTDDNNNGNKNKKKANKWRHNDAIKMGLWAGFQVFRQYVVANSEKMSELRFGKTK